MAFCHLCYDYRHPCYDYCHPCYDESLGRFCPSGYGHVFACSATDSRLRGFVSGLSSVDTVASTFVLR